MIRTLIAEQDRTYCMMLSQGLEMHSDIKVISMAYDGEDALKQISMFRPDVVLTDTTMPHIGELELLRRLPETETAPIVIVMSSEHSDRIKKACLELGAACFMRKPFSVQQLIDQILRFWHREQQKCKIQDRSYELELSVRHELCRLGVPANMKGYRYIREAILLQIEDDTIIFAIVGKLYPTIAEKYEVEWTQVERDIRLAISAAWAKGNRQKLRALFHRSEDGSRDKTSNSEFIATVAEYVRFDYASRRKETLICSSTAAVL